MRNLRATRLAPVALVAATLLVYANSLENPFVFDDLGAIVDNRDIRQVRFAPAGALYLSGCCAPVAGACAAGLCVHPLVAGPSAPQSVYQLRESAQ